MLIYTLISTFYMQLKLNIAIKNTMNVLLCRMLTVNCTAFIFLNFIAKISAKLNKTIFHIFVQFELTENYCTLPLNCNFWNTFNYKNFQRPLVLNLNILYKSFPAKNFEIFVNSPEGPKQRCLHENYMKVLFHWKMIQYYIWKQYVAYMNFI